MELLVSATKCQPDTIRPTRFLSELEKVQHAGGVLWTLDVESGLFRTFFTPDPEQVAKWPRTAPSGPMKLDRMTCVSEYDGRYFLTTFNEILVVDRETAELVDVYSQPSFNDLHHCFADEMGQVVANTGLDCIEIFDRDWRMVDRIRFEDVRDIDGRDWRQCPSTKPHTCHANHVFRVQGELWCTRCLKKDAVKLRDPSARMDIADGLAHDGLVHGDSVLFTTVNGSVVTFSTNNGYQRKSTICVPDLMPEEYAAWVRGVCVVDDAIFVGATRLRSTYSKEFQSWLGGKVPRLHNSAVLRIAAHDRCFQRAFLTPEPAAAVFSILKR